MKKLLAARVPTTMPTSGAIARDECPAKTIEVISRPVPAAAPRAPCG